ncbi:MAG: eCIS core domain-containing protein [Sulfuricaulis sp.]
MDRLLYTVLAAVLLLGIVGQACAQELIFAPATDSRRILLAKDTFVARMSPFDRAARMKTDRDVTESQFLEFVASAALDWEQHEKGIVESAFRKIRPVVTRLSLPLPDRIYVIKTSGAEEGNAAYTRENAIVLPRSILASSERELQRLLAHELFHISSRTHPKLAKSLYESIGFRYCGEVEFPTNLAPRKITNPDAPKNEYCIQLKFEGQKVWAVPILFSRTPRYDTSRGGEFFQYLQLALLLVEAPANASAPQALYDSRGPRLVGIQQVSGFFEQVGQNTEYIIHPEEILADNFALLVLGERNVRSPEILARMQSALAKFSEEELRAAGTNRKRGTAEKIR